MQKKTRVQKKNRGDKCVAWTGTSMDGFPVVRFQRFVNARLKEEKISKLVWSFGQKKSVLAIS